MEPLSEPLEGSEQTANDSSCHSVFTLEESKAAHASYKERLALLKSKLRLDHLNFEEKSEILALCEEYNDLFYLDGDKLTYTTTLEHSIPIMPEHQGKIINQKNYRIPEAHKAEVQHQVKQMLDDEIISPRALGIFPY